MFSFQSKVAYIIGVGCERINGNFHITNIDLSIIEEFNSETKTSVTKIIDKTSSFELITSGGFSIAQGLESEFGKSFDKFII